MGWREVPSFFRPSLWHVVFRKELHWCTPSIAVRRGLQHGLTWCLMLMTGISQIVHIELPVPIRHHRLVVVGPRFSPSHRLDGMNTDNRFQSTVMPFRTGDGTTAIVYHVTVVFDETLHQLLVRHEYRAMLMSYRKADTTRLVLEGLEVLGAMGTVYLIAITVIVDIPPVPYFCRRRSFGKLFRKRFRGSTPRTVWRLTKSDFDITHRTGVILHHHHIVIRSPLHQCRVDSTETGVIEELCLRERLEVLRRHVIQAVVVLMILLIVRELARHTRCPYNQELFLHIVIKQFWSPRVHRRLLHPCIDKALRGPVDQIL